jgi:acyl-CoA thioester hydrolase
VNRDVTPSEPGSHRVFTHQFRVFYADTDQMGVAYYANYLRWFEMARNEYLRAAGFTYKRIEALGVRLPVVEAGCRYARPAHYDDWLRVEAWIESVGRVRIRFGYRVVRGDEPAALATGFTVHASVSEAGAPSRPPAELVRALADFDPALAGR